MRSERINSAYARGGSASQTQGPFLFVTFTLVSALILGVGLVMGFTQMASLITVPFALASAGFILFQMGGEYDLLHPIRIFGFMWCLCIALASLRLVTKISVWGPATWFYLVIALLSFIGGFLLLNYLLPGRRQTPAGQAAVAFQPSALLPVKAGLIVAVVALIVGLAGLGYRYYLTGEIPVLANGIGKAGTRFFATASQWRDPEFDTLPNKIIGLTGLYCRYAAYMATIVLCQKLRKTRTQIIIAFAVVLIGLAGLGSQGGRGFLVEYAVAAAVFFHYLRRRIRLQEVVISGVLLILFLSFAGYYRALTGEADERKEATRISKLPPGRVGDSLAFGYFSITRPMETFARMSEDLPAMKLPSGEFLFYSLHRLIPRENIEEFATRYYGGDMMTPTFLGEFFADFGLPGIIIGCMVLGLAYSYVYWRAIRGDSVFWLSAQAIFMILLVYFPHANFFSQNLNWIFDLVNMAGLTWLAKLGKKEQVSATSGSRIPARVRPNFGRVGYHH